MSRMKDTYYDRGQEVARALMYGLTVTVETDEGEFDFSGDDLRQVWGELAPGEAFDIVRVSDDFPHTGQHLQGCRACYAYNDARGGAL